MNFFPVIGDNCHLSVTINLQLFDADMSVRRKLARRCVELFFKMMFDHNFVHGDLHPGNLQIKGFDDQGMVFTDLLLSELC